MPTHVPRWITDPSEPQAETNHRKATGHCQSPRSAGFHARMHVGLGHRDRVSPVYWQISEYMTFVGTSLHEGGRYTTVRTVMKNNAWDQKKGSADCKGTRDTYALRWSFVMHEQAIVDDDCLLLLSLYVRGWDPLIALLSVGVGGSSGDQQNAE
ncbi:hypothetical protein BC827DRAFT_1159211 [Russula dissimulans]|nr:hypothetical protein BC827DRAFT_1159211 [Russula dissimulans]